MKLDKEFYEIYSLNPGQFDDVKIKETRFSAPLRRILEWMGIKTVGDLLRTRPDKLSKFPLFKSSHYDQINQYFLNISGYAKQVDIYPEKTIEEHMIMESEFQEDIESSIDNFNSVSSQSEETVVIAERNVKCDEIDTVKEKKEDEVEQEIVEEETPLYKLYSLNLSDFENVSIDNVMWSVRVSNCLHRANIHTIDKLLEMSVVELKKIKNFGAGCLKEVQSYVKELNKQEEIKLIMETQKENTAKLKFKDYKENIAKGDFSFIEESSESAELLIKQYSEAREIIGEELALKCVQDPAVSMVLVQSLNHFSKIVEIGKKVLPLIPIEKRKNRVLYYIEASAYKELKVLISDSNETLEDFIKSNIDNKKVIQWIERTEYDIEKLTIKFFEELKAKGRGYSIVNMRAKGLTLEQVGNEFEVTRERIRQIEKKAARNFVVWLRKNHILAKMIAVENGRHVFDVAALELYFGEYAGCVAHLLKLNEKEYSEIVYDSEIEVFTFGRDDTLQRAYDYISKLPESFHENSLQEYFQKAIEELEIPQFLLEKILSKYYKKTAATYHTSRMTLAKIYDAVLRKYYPEGIWIYSDEALAEFKKHVQADYGDIKLPENNRAMVGRLSAVGILCGRGTYCAKKDFYISEELLEDIHSYIIENDTPVFLINTIYNAFEERLISEGVSNKYFLQGILREHYESEFFFRRDYVSKDQTITSIYSEIVGFIEKSPYPVTKKSINDTFPGLTEIVISFAINDPEVINLFGEYIHARRLKIDEEDKEYLEEVLKDAISKNQCLHCKDIYGQVLRDNPNLLTSNSVYQAFGLYSILEYYYRDEYEFSRPYIAAKGTKITRSLEQIHEMVEESEIISVAEIQNEAKENYLTIYSILDFIDSCNETHLLLDNKELATIEYIGVTEEHAKKMEALICEELVGTRYISDLMCINRFEKVNVPWSEWLIYSIINKWSTKLEVAASAPTFRNSKALISIKGMIDVENVQGEVAGEVYVADDLEDIDELISDVIFEEL